MFEWLKNKKKGKTRNGSNFDKIPPRNIIRVWFMKLWKTSGSSFSRLKLGLRWLSLNIRRENNVKERVLLCFVGDILHKTQYSLNMQPSRECLQFSWLRLLIFPHYSLPSSPLIWSFFLDCQDSFAASPSSSEFASASSQSFRTTAKLL